MDILTANSLQRVLAIRTDLGSGTAFTIPHGGGEYLVTAKHLLPKDAVTPEVVVRGTLISRTLRLTLLTVEPESADVAVAQLDEPLTPLLPLPASKDGIIYGQRLYFLGFPYGLGTEYVRGEPEQRVAFVKGAVFSAQANVDGVDLLYLDGMNNPGFSGGPVVFNRDGDHLRPQVCGVISGYRTERQPVFQGTTPLGAVTATANTGIILATDIQHVTAAIHRAA